MFEWIPTVQYMKMLEGLKETDQILIKENSDETYKTHY